MRFNFIVLLLLSFTFAISKPLPYNELIKKPQGIAKDYYIYRFLNENKNATEKQAQTLYMQVSRMNSKLQDLFDKKITNNETIKKEIRCKGLSAEHMVQSEDEECIMMRISPSLVANLSSENKTKLEELLTNNPYTKSWVEAMNSEDVFGNLQKTGAKQFLSVFNGSLNKYKKEYLDRSLSEEFILELEPLSSFTAMVKHVVLAEPYLEKIPLSLIYIPQENSSLTHETAFFLGLNAINHEVPKIADMFFEVAHKKAYFQSDKDKSLFWRYLSTNNEEYLKNISESFDINIYSLYAKEYFDVNITNVIYIKKTANKNPKFHMQDPFEWKNLLDSLKNISDENLTKKINSFNSTKTLAIYAYLLERQARYKNSYFITPYKDALNNSTIDRQALIYAIARQESRFIPSSISTSYALGMMQIMPFLAKDIAKNKKIKKFDIDDMFDPLLSLDFANYHLDFLNKHLQHPLFVAYAYNGGIGFTRRTLQTGRYFNKSNYEPFLSIETIPYEESREYGKKVLANYIIYMNLFGENINIRNLFEELFEPEKTDKYR